MKKISLFLMLLFLVTGCMRIDTAEVDDIINNIQLSNIKLNNQNRTGYKYYLPTNFNVRETDNLNEIFVAGNYQYYMYVDLISYYEKVEFTYENSPNSYLSKAINHNGITGYLEVNVKQDKYLIEIMYNYAKIEVIVDQDYLNEAIAQSLIILSTVKYHDDIIKNMLGDDILSFGEEPLDIFKTNKGESNFLEYVDEYDNYEGDDVPDRDKIN